MRFLIILLLLAGCAVSSQTGSYQGNSESTRVEYFNAPFQTVVDATLATLSDLGMYVEDRHRSGPDQLITVRSPMSGSSFENMLNIRIERPTAQGVAVTISRKRPDGGGYYADEAQSIFLGISTRLGR